MAKHIITNIVGQSSKYDLAKISNSYTLNMFEETVDGNESFVNKVLRPIPGMEKICDISGNCRGLYTVSVGYKGNPTTYAVFGDKVYIILENNTPYEIGTIPYGSGPVHFAETGNREGFDAHLVIVDGYSCYAVDTQIRPANQIDDFSIIELPFRNVDDAQRILPTHIAYLYGYIIVNDKNTDNFYVSYQFPFERNNENNEVDKNIFMVGSEEWGDTGLSIQSYWQPDNTTAIIANGTRLFTFGEKSYQIFQYTNDMNVPFNSPDTAAGMIGLKAVNSLQQLGNIIIWLGSSDIGNNGIYLNNGGTQVQRISTVEIERRISSLPTVKDAVAQIWQDHQHIFYVIDFPSGNMTLCYDLTEQSWSDRCSITDKNEQKSWRYGFATMDREGNILHSAENCIVKETESKWNEHDDNSILRLRRGGIIYSDNSYFYIDDIEVNTNNGQYENIKYKNADMMMRFSTDGSTWSDLEVVDIGKTGDYDFDCVFYNFGLARYFTLELSCTDNIPFSLYSIKINAEPCAW